MKAILADKIAPGLLDRLLARTGYESQQTDEPENPSRPDNLWNPVAVDHGAHGRFDSRAGASSAQVWATRHRGALLAAAGVLAAAATFATRNFDLRSYFPDSKGVS